MADSTCTPTSIPTRLVAPGSPPSFIRTQAQADDYRGGFILTECFFTLCHERDGL